MNGVWQFLSPRRAGGAWVGALALLAVAADARALDGAAGQGPAQTATQAPAPYSPGSRYQVAQSAAPKFSFPVRCKPGLSCWILSYVDHDPSAGISDYRCGNATYNGINAKDLRHNGTDIAIWNLKAMRRGVAVVAPAPGLVLAVRDGMADVNIKEIGGPQAVAGKECGNGMRIRHAGEWETQYCHMRQDSIAVRKGDRVKTGQVLGMVGISGAAEMPHLHFQVKHRGTIVDPFVGKGPRPDCQVGSSPLWTPDVLAKLPYRSVHIYNAGFSGSKPTAKGIRDGAVRAKTLAADAPALFLWVEVFWPGPGDVVTFTIVGPGKKLVLRESVTIGKRRGRQIRAAVAKRRDRPWPSGTYRGEVRLVRADGPAGKEGYATRVSIKVP